MKVVLCSGCNSFQIDPRDLVGTWDHWHVVVNHNQNYLGKVMLVLRRHELDATNLLPVEQTELWRLMREVKIALVGAFQPEHFNYAFLMNLDAHVHMHVIPRYTAEREFAGLLFDDGQVGEHYQLTRNVVPPAVRQQLVFALRGQGLAPPAQREWGLFDARGLG
jgi:diadenosine tetraphosphate (Ap4A) HIT family hydrolase